MTDKLREYTEKRKFSATPEPPAAVARRAGAGQGPLLFVVQLHEASRTHYDFRLECDGVLKSWAVPKGPSLNPADKRLAMPTEDHPYDYASFEGVIPPGQYGAGEVIVWDCGTYSPDEDDKGVRGETFFHDRGEAEKRVRRGLAAGKLGFTLRGEKLKGSFALVRMKQAASAKAEDPVWLLIKHKDRFVTTADVTQQDRSVLCGATVAEMKSVPARRRDAASIAPAGATVKLPATLEPMQAQLGEVAFNNEAWGWEPKLDGYRALAFLTSSGVSLRSRRGLELAPQFPAMCGELAEQHAPGTILDGEIVVLDAAGMPSFNALQNRVQLKSPRELAQALQQQQMDRRLIGARTRQAHDLLELGQALRCRRKQRPDLDSLFGSFLWHRLARRPRKFDDALDGKSEQHEQADAEQHQQRDAQPTEIEIEAGIVALHGRGRIVLDALVLDDLLNDIVGGFDAGRRGIGERPIGEQQRRQGSPRHQAEKQPGDSRRAAHPMAAHLARRIPHGCSTLPRSGAKGAS